MVLNEINILREVDHPSISKLQRVYENQDTIYFVIDLVQGETFLDLIWRQKKLSEQESAKIVQELLDVLNYLHSRQILHRDLKQENVMITELGKVFVIDFGLSCFARRGKGTGMCGSPGYCAPESLAGKQYDYKADFFSVGVILYILLSGVEPCN